MAAITSTVIAGIGLATSAYQIVDNINEKKQAEEDLRNFNRQEYTNPNENIIVDTTKADQMTKANNINVATSVDALQRLDTRGVLGGIPKINESSIFLQDKISEDLARQERENDILIAKGESEILRVKEQREREALLGIGQELNIANQNIVTGLSDFASSGLALGSALKGVGNSDGGSDLDFDTKTSISDNINDVIIDTNGFRNNVDGDYVIDPMTGLPVRNNLIRNV